MSNNLVNGLLQSIALAGMGIGSYYASQRRDGSAIMDIVVQSGAPQSLLQLLNPSQPNPAEISQSNEMVNSLVAQNKSLQDQNDALRNQVTALTNQINTLSAQMALLIDALNKK